jgi:tetratricopeptide (TPR) repeat protein
MDSVIKIIDLLVKTEQYDLARNLLDGISNYMPKNTEGLDMLSYANYKAKRYLKAIEYGELALGSTMDANVKNSIRFNLSKCYNFANFPEKSNACIKKNIDLNPDDVDSILDYVVSLYALNRKVEAEEQLRLIEYSDKFDEKNLTAIKFNLGVHELRKGNLSQGFNYLSLGRTLRIWGSYTHKFPIPEFTKGTDITGKKVLVIGEGGIGDEVINARFAKHIRDLGGIPSWASAHGLNYLMEQTGLFENCINYKNFTTDIPTIKDYDYWAPAMNLPLSVGIEKYDELWNGPYLKTLPEYNDKWKQKITSNKIKVGIRWSGNPLYEQDLHRTLPLDKLQALFDPEKYQLYSLQKDEIAAEIKQYPHIIDLNDELKDWNDTMSAMSQMDVIVSSCTSIVHVAGALGIKAFLLTPIMSYYTWAEESEHSSWYGNNFTVLHQTETRKWNIELQKLKHTLDSETN